MKKAASPSATLAQEAAKHNLAGLAVFDWDGRKLSTLYLNKSFYALIDDKKENRLAYKGSKTMNAVHPDDRPMIKNAIKESIRTMQTIDIRYRIINGRKEYQWLGLRTVVEKRPNGHYRFYGTYYDANELVHERQHTADIIEHVPAGISLCAITDSGLIVKYANAFFYQIHCWDEKFFALHANKIIELAHPDDRHLFGECLNSLRQGAKTVEPLTYRALGNDGQYHWVTSHFSFAYYEAGLPTFYISSVNIEQRVAAERERDRINRMYESATKDMKVIVWDYDLANHRAIMMERGYSGEICARYGIPLVVENVPDSLLPYIHPDDQAEFMKAYNAVAEGKDESSSEFRFTPKQGGPIQYERLSFRRIYDSDGELLGIFGSGQNVTALRLEKERYEKAVAALQGPEYYASFRINLTKNTCGNGNLGKSEAENVNINSLESSGTADGYFSNFCSLIADESVQADFQRRFRREVVIDNYEKGITSVSIDYPFLYKNGERHWRRGTISLLKNPSSGDLEGVAYSSDIDAEKRSEFLIRDLSANSFDYIGLIHLNDRTFEFLSKNDIVDYGQIGVRIPYADCLDYVRAMFVDQVPGKPLIETLAIDYIASALRRSGPYAVSYNVFRAGVPHSYQFRYSWFEKPEGDILVVRTDITEAYVKETGLIRELKEAKEEAEKANAAKSDFLSRMSHDIRTPLNGIIGLTYLASELDLPPKAKEYLAKTDTSSKFLLGLVNDILDLTKAESGKLDLHPEPYPFDELTHYLEAVSLPLFARRYQNFRLEKRRILSDQIPCVDKLRINQIVFNLLSNASKYSPEGSEIVYLVDEAPAGKRQMSLHIEIRDHGKGMSKEFLAHLFEPFHQEQGSDQADMRGSGLGLAITKKLVDAMNGRIAVESELGKGSVFSLDFLFDSVSPSEVEASLNKKSEPADFERLKGKHVLLVEDNAINSEIAQTILREKGLEVTVAMDGLAGKRTFEQSSSGYYNLILMDLRMPVMDGIAATKAIRALPRSDAQSVPIVAMTADAFAEDVKRCKDAGMNGHLAKPIEPAKLFDEILRLIH